MRIIIRLNVRGNVLYWEKEEKKATDEPGWSQFRLPQNRRAARKNKWGFSVPNIGYVWE